MSDALLERALVALGAIEARHSPGGHPHDQQDHAGGAKGVVKKAVDKLTGTKAVLAGDFSGLEKVGGQRGSNPGGLYKDSDGQQWYVKQAKSKRHAANEALASDLYKEARVDAAEVHAGSGAPGLDGEQQVASKWVDLDPGAHVRNFEDLEREDAQAGFAVDAWLANWDVVGSEFNNIGLDRRGNPIRLDAGGALEFRARGDLKGDAFGDTVTEWDTLRDKSKNRHAAELFGDMDDDALASSAEDLALVHERRIRELVAKHGLDPALADKLIARRADVLRRGELIRLQQEAASGGGVGSRGEKTGRAGLEAAAARLPDRAGGANVPDLDAQLAFKADTGWDAGKLADVSRTGRLYRAGLFIDIAKYLRGESTETSVDVRDGTKITKEDVRKHIAALDEVMDHAGLTEPVETWRGIQRPEKVFGDAWSSDSMVGVEWDEKSFQSTSTSRDVASGFGGGGALMRMHLPKGVGAVQLSGFPTEATRARNEAELMVQRGLRMRITGDSADDRGRRVFDVEVVPADEGRSAQPQASKKNGNPPESMSPGMQRIIMNYEVDAVRGSSRPTVRAQSSVGDALLERALVAIGALDHPHDIRYSAQQPRVPAGSDDGGQFGPGKKKDPQRTFSYNPRTGRGAGYGVKGGDPQVKAFQELANRLGIADDKGRKLAVDGKYGPLTTQAAKSLQTKLGLEATGRITQSLLDKVANAKTLDEAKQALKAKPKRPNKRLQEIVAAEVRALLRGDIDDDPIGELDDDTVILLMALDELDQERAELEGRAWNPALHARWPKGHPKAGKFRTMVDLLKMAIANHDGKGHPFDNFKREQLVKAAKTRGITLKRGEDKDSIAAKLLADLGGTQTKPKPATTPNTAPVKSATGVVTVPGPAWPTGDKTTEVQLNGDKLGIVVHSAKTGGLYPFIPGGSKKTPLGHTVRVKPGSGSGYQTEQAAVDAIVQAHTPVRVSGPGLAGLNLAEQRIEPQTVHGSRQLSKTSYEISQNGKPLGTVHDFSYGWEARDASGKTVGLSQGGFIQKSIFKTKSDALSALVTKAGTPAAPAPPAPTPVPAAVIKAGTPGPEVQAAIDIVYGNDPKGHTMSRQLAVYGAMRRNHFDQLGPDEQSTVLGDLAYIAAKSKGKSSTDAANLVHRFTPAGTTPGSVSKQSIQLPPDVVAAQTRVADPNGTPGMLKVRDPKDRGANGDGWTRLPNGGTGPWGKYGAAGVMLRHVDPADGKERFLMVQRGPGISDPGKWQFPGGAIDSKESPHEGAARETVEELGFKAADMLGARVHGHHETGIPGSKWKYTSIAATVNKQLVPDLSTHHAQMETSDAKWMTRDEIRKLDSGGKLLKPLAGGQLETNVMTLFPSKATPAPAGAPGMRPARLTGTPTVAALKAPHKPSRGVDLLPDDAAKNALRQQIKNDRKKFAGKAADDRLAAIGALQGFDETPTVVSKAEMDRLLKTGDYIEAWRGVQGKGAGYRGPGRGGAVSNTKTAAQINEEFRSGTAYYGNGIFGNGYYFAASKQVAQGYTDHTPGSLVRVLIPKTAKMIDHGPAIRGARSVASPTSKAKGKSHEEGTLYDEGRYAAAKGFDMIVIDSSKVSGSSHVASPGKPAFNIVNRSVLIVQEA